MPALLYRLARANRKAIFLVTLVLIVALLFTPGLLGGVLLLALVAALFTLSTLTWPVQPPVTRVARLAVLAGLTLIAVIKLTH